MVIYPVVIETDNDFPYKHIYPTHQQEVYNILNALRDDVTINQIILFGSIVTLKAGQESDIDLILIRNTNEYKKYVHNGSIPVDILDITEEDFFNKRRKINTVYNEAYEMGIVIFNRRALK